MINRPFCRRCPASFPPSSWSSSSSWASFSSTCTAAGTPEAWVSASRWGWRPTTRGSADPTTTRSSWSTPRRSSRSTTTTITTTTSAAAPSPSRFESSKSHLINFLHPATFKHQQDNLVLVNDLKLPGYGKISQLLPTARRSIRVKTWFLDCNNSFAWSKSVIFKKVLKRQKSLRWSASHSR